MPDMIDKTHRLYNAMIEALNNFYWDNSISPDETAARLDEFAAEVSRLSKFIRDNAPPLTRDAEQRNGADVAGQDCPICNDSGVDPDSPDGLERLCPNCGGQS